MKTLKLIAFLSIVCIAFHFQAVAQTDPQDTTKLYSIIKTDGTEYVGKILSDDGREVLIETKAMGKIYIPKASIRSITLIENKGQIVNNEYVDEGPFTTRYYLTTNAFPIKKGENYVLIHLYGPEVHFALTDRFSLGVMTTWIASPIALAAKYSFPTANENLNFSLGAIVGSSGYLNSARGYGGLYFGTVTIGDRLKNISVSAGYGHLQAGFRNSYYDNSGMFYYEPRPKKEAPILGLGGIAKVGKKASFIFDCMIGFSKKTVSYSVYSQSPVYDPDGNFAYYSVDYDHPVNVSETGRKISAFLMPGMRFQSSEKHAFQVALAGVIEWSAVGFSHGSVYTDNANTYKAKPISGTRSFPIPMCSWLIKF